MRLIARLICNDHYKYVNCDSYNILGQKIKKI